MSYEAAPNSHHSVSILLTRDRRLSFRARAIAIRLLSNAPGFRMTATDLARESPSEGRYAVLSAMKELRKFGYAKVIRHQDERGRWNTATRIFHTPQPECDDCTSDTEVQSPNSGAPNPGEPASGDRTPKSSSNKKNLQEETTTPPEELNFEAEGLRELDPAVVVKKLGDLATSVQQDVLDELASNVEDGKASSPYGLLDTLVQAAKDGGFRFSRGRKVRDRRLAKAKPERNRRPGESTESPYENAVNFAGQTYGPNAAEPNKSEFDRLIAEAAKKWPAESKTHSVATSPYRDIAARKQSKHNLSAKQGATS